MKQLCIWIIAVVLFTSAVGAQKSKTQQTKQQPKSKTSVLKTDEEKMNYLSGYDLGTKLSASVKASNFPLRVPSFVTGLQEALEGLENKLAQDEIQRIIALIQQLNPQSQSQQNSAETVAQCKKEGSEFLAANKSKDSIITTSSGLQYKILRPGTGKSPAETSMVTVHYRGRLLNGTVFDESYRRGEPTSFMLNQVIKGWTEGLQLMKEGGKCEFYIPNNLAYGDRPVGQLIPGGSTLIFEVELLEVK
ncbi:MAG: FKBP-type peptidyl-prolyl cis-trans isomerase [Bacteroidota bacterium]